MIQKMINNILGTTAQAVVAAKAIKSMSKQADMEDKYGAGGQVESGISKEMGNLSLEESKAIQGDLGIMREQAKTTDTLEKKKKLFGMIPTKESKAIRQEGLERKAANIDALKAKIALMRSQGAINARAEQNSRARKKKGGM